ncbi:putative DCC family thiol-disulfide oxidoreductase YuxK [Ulvibacter sp. MAR_2010_11]|uniref:thiol-disulfide oxidoreductase DCC family protein n=1 Tax=Ulvibacter sp. MAR_2010_11 TaxID=1250229 RepID=UPI000C2B9B6B|nr:thiol-disulfide oxidoreductase DCC family protein [Ulvibacter sp. MAR_2010_11]PKA84208.1 putative DCC family thiol-disulfide oxidoreductase YuxK [Ulvibacter sp. MAR_2010_11]
MTVENSKKIILFDGVCNLCSSSVIRLIKHDPKDLFRFAALQSEIGQQLVAEYNIDTSKIDSIILIENGKAYVKSTAALRAARHMSGGYPLLSVLLIFPAFIRNWVYDYIAKNRYRWYGKKESCMIPTPDLKAKFL